MGFPSLFDLEKVLISPSKLGWKVEIRYMHLVAALNVPLILFSLSALLAANVLFS